MKQPFTREQRTTIIYGVLCLVLILVVMQLWLLTATMNAYLGGDDAVIWPALLASLACFALNASLLRSLRSMEFSGGSPIRLGSPPARISDPPLNGPHHPCGKAKPGL